MTTSFGNTGKFDAIFTSDWHITSMSPLCRKDDYLKTLKKKIIFIFGTAARHNVPVFIAGDIGDKPMWRGKLFAEILTLLKVLQTRVRIYAIAGQHDLPYHNLDQYKDSAIWLLHCAGFLTFLRRPTKFENFVVYPHHYGIPIGGSYTFLDGDKERDDGKRRVALIHQLVCKNESPGAIEMGSFYSHDILKSNPWFNLVVSGDNHLSFVDECDKNRKFLNCGSLMRRDVTQIDQVPLIYLWNADENHIRPIIVPFEPDVWSNDAKEFYDPKSEVSLFVKSLTSSTELNLDFESNLKCFIDRNHKNISKEIKEKLLKLIEMKDSYENAL